MFLKFNCLFGKLAPRGLILKDNDFWSAIERKNAPHMLSIRMVRYFVTGNAILCRRAQCKKYILDIKCYYVEYIADTYFVVHKRVCIVWSLYVEYCYFKVRLILLYNFYSNQYFSCKVVIATFLFLLRTCLHIFSITIKFFIFAFDESLTH